MTYIYNVNNKNAFTYCNWSLSKDEKSSAYTHYNDCDNQKSLGTTVWKKVLSPNEQNIFRNLFILISRSPLNLQAKEGVVVLKMGQIYFLHISRKIWKTRFWPKTSLMFANSLERVFLAYNRESSELFYSVTVCQYSIFYIFPFVGDDN